MLLASRKFIFFIASQLMKKVSAILRHSYETHISIAVLNTCRFHSIYMLITEIPRNCPDRPTVPPQSQPGLSVSHSDSNQSPPEYTSEMLQLANWHGRAEHKFSSAGEYLHTYLVCAATLSAVQTIKF
jgi:hypothetical protein